MILMSLKRRRSHPRPWLPSPGSSPGSDALHALVSSNHANDEVRIRTHSVRKAERPPRYPRESQGRRMPAARRLRAKTNYAASEADVGDSPWRFIARLTALPSAAIVKGLRSTS
jgi:hypothetical protein